MANIKLSDFPKHLQDKLTKILDEVTKPSEMQKMAEELKAGVVKRTKLGYGVDEPMGKQIKLKPLSEGYRQQRKDLKLDSTTTAGKSNLTQTGDMLNDLVVKASEGKVTIELGSRESKQKATWNADLGRVFMNISATQYKQLVADLKKKILNLLNK